MVREELITVKTETMTLIYEKAGRWYCQVNFYVNGITGSECDFGDKNPGGRDGYRCLNMHFEPDDPTDEILERYGITENDYKIIVDMLCEQLAFGNCCMCD